MMSQYIKLIFLSLACGLFLGSCYKDQGNYDYTEINKLTISMDSAYYGVYGKNLKITPKIMLTQDAEASTYDTTKYSYEWIAINPGALVAAQRFYLGTTRDLNATLSALPGAYTVYYRITDKKTGVQWQKTCKLTITTSIYEGWLVLSDVNNAARLDMVSLVNGTYSTIPSVLDSVGSGLPAQGKPLFVAYSPYSPSTTGIYISSETGTNRVDQESFKWSSTLNIKYEMMANVPTNFAADALYASGGNTQYMHAYNNFYYYNYVYNTYFGIPINTMQGESTPFKTSVYLAYNSTYGAILYDMDKKRFVKQPYGQTTCVPMPTDSTYFSYTTNKTLSYMEVTRYANGEVFAILKDPATDKSYLARFNFGQNIIQTFYGEIKGTDFTNATAYAISPDFGYVFYSVGGKVYEYDMGLQQSKLMVDKGTAKVTTLQFQHFLSNKYINGTAGAQVLYNKLVVGSYDPAKPAGSCGTLDLYTVPPINGDLQLYQTYTGFGKIASVSYRER